MPKIDADALELVFLDSLFQKGESTAGAVMVEGITGTFGFHPLRLESHRAEVMAWLDRLPHPFRQDEGGGWSFVNACEDDTGEQWGEHRNVEQLMVLGLGLGLVRMLMEREMWEALPGAMPYFMVVSAARAAGRGTTPAS